ncbi:helix-turn-helix transcriptional regulator [Gymnodinialimonas sp. 2305UL16-5]|uniref:helix-turn-helix transcriptional regulator n=1 Tax=Gymnodinialimonas mytili TaxID=3126503 RepID=UPI0030B6D627
MSRQDKAPLTAADSSAARLQSQVGDRVRAARRDMGISRRILAERSGVSPRYLAQLESGAGNISIGLLLRVATALNLPIVSLIDAISPEARDIAIRFDRAGTVLRDDIRRRLLDQSKAGRICLIGLRGAGKSTLGAAVARTLDLPFVELNREIEAQGGMPVAEVMALYGSDGYRQLEADALARIEAEYQSVVVAVGGGIVGEPAIFDRLLARFHTVWIKASPNEHMARVLAQGDTRPMEGNPQAMAQLRLLLASREDDYARADAVLDTSNMTVATSLADLIALIDNNGFLPPTLDAVD